MMRPRTKKRRMAAAFLPPAMLAAWLLAGLQTATPITTAAASGTTGADTMTSQTSDKHRHETQAGQTGATARASSSATASASAHARPGSSGDDAGDCIAESRASAEASADGERHTDQDSDREVARGDDCRAHAQSRASARTGGVDADGGTAE